MFAFCLLILHCYKFELTTSRCSFRGKTGRLLRGFSLSQKSMKSNPTVIHSSVWKANKWNGWVWEASSVSLIETHLFIVLPVRSTSVRHGSSCYKSLYSVSINILLSWESDRGDPLQRDAHLLFDTQVEVTLALF